MPVKKSQQRAAKKPNTGLNPAYKPTKKQSEAAQKRAEADMKKHGFKTVDELIEHYDKRRGY